MKDRIIKGLSYDPYYMELCYKYCNGHELWRDLYQFIFLTLLEMKDEDFFMIKDYRRYINRMVWLNWISSNSPFRKMYDFSTIELDDNLIDKEIELDTSDLEVVEQVLNEFIAESRKKGQYHWKNKLFEMYVEEGNIREVSRKVGIPYPTVRYNLTQIIDAINERITRNNTKTNWN